jgi:hypothetical protein
MVGRRRVAVLGGDGRFNKEAFPAWRVRTYRGLRTGGDGELKRLQDALKAGGFDLVIILGRGNAHSVTKTIRRLCRRLGVPIESRR